MYARLRLRLFHVCLVVGLLALSLSAPPALRAAPSEAGAPFTITWLPTCGTPPADAVSALAYAAGLWGTWISSPVPIAVTACWTPTLSGGDALATGMPSEYVTNFPGAPLVNVAYPIALANALHGADLNPARVDMALQFDSDVAWSFATTASVLDGEDFVAVALHELAHGLGFIGAMYEDYNVGFCGDGLYGYLYPCPTPYDWLVQDSGGTPLMDYYLSGQRTVLASRLKSDALFGGLNARSAYAGLPLKLYTPGTFAWGSSLSHLDQATFGGGDNRLMTPSYSGVTRAPGLATLGAFQDIGWLRADGVPNLSTAGWLLAGVGQAAPFSATLLWPAYAGETIDYTWNATGQTPLVHSIAAAADSAAFTWDSVGYQRITLTADGGVAPVSAARSVLVFDVTAGGTATGKPGVTYTFSAEAGPSITVPITFTWQATGQPGSVVHAGVYGGTDTVSYAWELPGTQVITVTAGTGGAWARDTHSVAIAGLVLNQRVYAPLVLRGD